jgi:hypothetical protein
MDAHSFKWFYAVLASIISVVCNTAAFIIVCTIAVCMDCYTAWKLSKRVKSKYPGANDGKFKSRNAKKILSSITEIYAAIILAYLIDHFILTMFSGLFLANYVAGLACFIEGWSMLENTSSCNDAKWAKLLQKVMVDKAERHFDIDLSELKHNDDENSN